MVVETVRARLLRVWLRGPQARLQLVRVRSGPESRSRAAPLGEVVVKRMRARLLRV